MAQPSRSARTSAHLRRRNLFRLTALLLSAGAVVTVSGCGSSAGHTTEQKAPSAAPTPSTDPQAQEKAKVLEVYRAMTDAEARTYATAKLDPELDKYAAHKALSDIKVTLFYQQQQGTEMKGQVSRSPKVTAIDTASDPLKAVVTDCADSSRYDEVRVKTGEVIPYKGSRRHVVTSTAERSKTGDWKFYTYVIDRERTC
ncbi:hypothetical protein ACH4PU_30420 [Streptomyces sp. NPDC021100]|uniref:hypothetical protein n=1 Tax=Streptomyces sp. NPDC021100 TaxID=3365114 RepID=UPI0037BD787A